MLIRNLEIHCKPWWLPLIWSAFDLQLYEDSAFDQLRRKEIAIKLALRMST